MRIEQFEAALWPYKLALIEAFELDKGKTSANMSITKDEATFKVIGLGLGAIENATVRHDGLTESASEVSFDAQGWNESQRKAVADYLGQFPEQP